MIIGIALDNKTDRVNNFSMRAETYEEQRLLGDLFEIVQASKILEFGSNGKVVGHLEANSKKDEKGA